MYNYIYKCLKKCKPNINLKNRIRKRKMIYRPVDLTPIFPLKKVLTTIINILWRKCIHSQIELRNGF